MPEQWKWIPGYEGFYEVSNIGRVRSHYYGGRILRPRPSVDGYEKYALQKDGKRWDVGGHRLVAMAFLPNPDNLPQVNHRDFCVTNNNVENLEWCSALWNMRHAEAGFRHSPETRGRAKLKFRDVEVIRRRAASGEKLIAIAADYKMHWKSISRVVNRKFWRHDRAAYGA
jgi:hypothetical protein